ncbi:MAG: D-aminopeptidase [Alphaproteobacteria bacterium]|nr:D-aminopeptidase [Alphaproteobacteria bacterium]
MSPSLDKRLDDLVRRLPVAYPGPGGAIAVLRRGEVLLRHAWGYANAERRIPFTPRTLFRVCSITKQFTCATLLQACPDPAVLEPALRARLARLGGPLPTIAQLAHNQSGLRDYWAVAMLLGAGAEDPFGDDEFGRMIAATRSTQFTPGTRYAYCNQNFRLISDLLEQHTGRDFAELLRRHVLGPAGMEGAILAADTRAMPDGAEGYEGTPGTGFRAAENRILWTGDAGLGASLDDMIAWERHIDATRDDPSSIYARLSAPVAFADGAPAAYGYGLARATEFGHAIVGHSGALRGWRSHRLHVAAERISVVVLFNHMSDPQAAAHDALALLLDAAKPVPDPALAPPPWLGTYAEPETGLAARIDLAAPGEVRLRFSHVAEKLRLLPDGSAVAGRIVLRAADDGLRLERPGENLRARLVPHGSEAPRRDIAGRYRCEELGAEIVVADAGGVLHGGCDGPLGRGRMEPLDPIGPDLWALPCPRALDVSPPGDWTLAIRRDGTGRVAGATVGCWLARGLDYVRIG